MNPTPQKPPRECFLYYNLTYVPTVHFTELNDEMIEFYKYHRCESFIERAYATRLEEALEKAKGAMRYYKAMGDGRYSDRDENGQVFDGDIIIEALSDIERILGETDESR